MLNNITKINKKNITFNLTSSSKATFYYPDNYQEIKKILLNLGKTKKKVLIKSGNCGYGDKSNLNESEFVISLSKIKKIINFDKKNQTVTAQSGVNLYELFSYLKKRGYLIYNIPGGKSVTLGGSIAGNVHGRPSKRNYENFGDNVISLKVMFENGKTKLITRKNKIFYNIIGSLGIYVIILEAKLKIHKINNHYVKKITRMIDGENEFKKYHSNLSSYYGYVNFFNINTFEANFVNFTLERKINESKVKKLSKYSVLEFVNFLKIPFFVSFFINSFTLKIFYNLLFYLNKKIKIFNKDETFTLEKSMYFDLIQVIPHFFRGGMIEIQFSTRSSGLLNLISILKKSFIIHNIFPYYFLLKKMESSKKKYHFNFPKNNSCISLAFSKNDYINNKNYFKYIYKILLKNKCNLYITKDETFIDNIDSSNLRKYLNLNPFLKNKVLSSDFKEKILNSIK